MMAWWPSWWEVQKSYYMRNCSSHRDSLPCGSEKRTKKILLISEDVRGKRQSKDNELADKDQPGEVNREQTESHSVVSDSLWPHGQYSPWNSPGKNTGVGSLSLLQGIFPTQGSNPGLPPCRQILYQLSHKGSPRILEWVAYPFSRGSSRPRNWTRVSCTAGGFFTNWAIREAYKYLLNANIKD